METVLEDETAQKEGIIILCDFGNTSFANFDFQLMSLSGDATENRLPLRIERLYVINQPYLFQMIYAVFGFLFRKVIEKIVVIGTDYDKLKQDFDDDQMLEIYGGKVPIDVNAFYDSIPE